MSEFWKQFGRVMKEGAEFRLRQQRQAGLAVSVRIVGRSGKAHVAEGVCGADESRIKTRSIT